MQKLLMTFTVHGVDQGHVDLVWAISSTTSVPGTNLDGSHYRTVKPGLRETTERREFANGSELSAIEAECERLGGIRI